MKRLLLALSIITAPLLADPEPSIPWDEFYNEQVAQVHDMIWECYESGDVQGASKFIVLLYALVNRKLPCHLEYKFENFR